MNNYDRVMFDALREDFSRKCDAEQPTLDFLLSEDNMGRVNT